MTFRLHFFNAMLCYHARIRLKNDDGADGSRVQRVLLGPQGASVLALAHRTRHAATPGKRHSQNPDVFGSTNLSVKSSPLGMSLSMRATS